ncbi:MAG TPA: non-ribosomal peptide synthetase, partial [Pseudomonas sp.]|uniref:non-ribosomal peptide synthetase n=1 Tax=Pseudomonas sp. TaxID=306 RepID=UPI002CB8FF3A
LNSVPFRLRLGDESWLQLIARIMEAERAMLPHRRYPLPRIVSDNDMRGALNILFNYTHFHVYEELGDLRDHITTYGVAGDDSFSLSIDFQLEGSRMTGWVIGLRSIYDTATLERYASCYSRMLRDITEDATRSVPRFDLLTENERQQMLHDWTATGQPVPSIAVSKLFEQQAALTPAATAVVCGEQLLTYAELNDRANRLAHLLMTQGLRPEDVVALALPRASGMVVAQLATLKAGAAFLSLDIDYPDARLVAMLGDARPRLLLTTDAVARRLDSPLPRLLLDTPATQQMLHTATSQNPGGAAIQGHHPAYVIYTSGSTGTPKGVVLTQAALTNLYHHNKQTLFERDLLAAKADSLRFAMTASFAFDSAIIGLLWLVAGHELHIVDDATRHDGERLVHYLSSQRIHGLDLTPSYLHQLQDCGVLTLGRDRPLSITVAGEAISEAQWQALKQAQGVLAYNFYGPTECTVDATFATIQGEHPPSIGTPIWNTQAYVLDACLQPVPVGVVGELYIAGVCLARGYLHRPALTAERFVANPFQPGQRMYRSGDLVRWRSDGQLEYLGRSDHQVKLRGFRVELGEIESALAQAGFTQNAVIIREGSSGQKQLVAYLVSALVDATGLRQRLAAVLPGYMIPSAFVALDTLPLTPNGKLDHHRLPAPDFSARCHREPRTSQEKILATLFAEVLGLERVSTDDSFFDLGGHSLLALRLISRIRRDLDAEIPLRTLFEMPTVVELAPQLSQARRPTRMPMRPMRESQSS